METVTVNAYAKINPSLDVTGIRPDGYHEVHMLLQQIALHDVIRLEKTLVPGISLKIIAGSGTAFAPSAKLTSSVTPAKSVSSASSEVYAYSAPSAVSASSASPAVSSSSVSSADVSSTAPADLPADSTNLTWRAAKLLIDTYHIDMGVNITLEKNIPVAAGLAGGSTDAAAVLQGMNALFDLHLSVGELCEHGLTLGADIPFCIRGGGQLAAGIGEKLTALAPMPACHILLVKPPEGISTGAVYRALDAVSDPEHPDIDAALRAYETGDLDLLSRVMGNILESVTLPMLPRLSEIKTALLSAGARGSMMSGSGPTMFGLFADPQTAHAAGIRLRNAYPDCRVILTQPVNTH